MTASTSLSPVLTHLNADSSWLLKLPIDAATSITLLIDPWLGNGDQVDFFPSFSRQWHGKSKPTYDSIQALQAEHNFDAVLISHDFSDHCHKETLLQVDPGIPVFAGTKEAMSRLKSFKHFRSVVAIPTWSERATKGERWQECGTVLASVLSDEQGINLPSSIPATLGFAYIPTTGKLDFARLHGVNLISYRPASVDASSPSPVFLYTPHGVPPGSFDAFHRLHGHQLDVLALLHSLDLVSNPIWLGGVIALGHRSALDIARLLKPRLLISTHDEDDKVAQGLVSKVLQRTKAPSVEEIDGMLDKMDVRTRTTMVRNGGRLEVTE